MGIEKLLGKIIVNIERVPEDNDQFEGEHLFFTTQCGEKYKMYHLQSCCEKVYIQDICGNLDDLLESPVLKAEERSNSNDSEYLRKTWTFYEVATIKGSVTIRWHGSSNGYYSVEVEFEEYEKQS